VRDPAVNRLTVVANESYEDFANQLQREMVEAGVRFKRDMVKNERDKVTVRLRKGYDTDSQFLALWERIRARTRYSVDYKTSELIAKAASRIQSKMPAIERPKVALTRAEIAIGVEGVVGKQVGYRTQSVEAKYVMPDFVGQVQAKTGLSKSTVARILLDSGRLNEAVNNPQAFIDHTSEIVNAVKREFLVYGDGSDGSGVKYTRLDNVYYEMRCFENDDLMEVFSANVRAVEKQEKTLFSHIVIDSNSGPNALLLSHARTTRMCCSTSSCRAGSGSTRRSGRTTPTGHWPTATMRRSILWRKRRRPGLAITCNSTCCGRLKTCVSSAENATSRTSSKCSLRL